MTHKMYKSLTEEQMAQMRWKTSRPIANRGGEKIEAGVEVGIVMKWRGLGIKSLGTPPIFITKVAPEAIIPLEEAHASE